MTRRTGSRSRSRGPRSIEQGIRRLRAQIAPPTLLAAVQDCWPEAVGTAIAIEATPVSERAGVVTVRCRSATWTAELSLLSGDLLDRLNGALEGRGRVQALRFLTGPI
jgi:predicted nucleic acid-binding Zn ribbon protein